MDTEDSFMKRQEHQNANSPTSICKVEKNWSYFSTFPYSFVAYTGAILHAENCMSSLNTEVNGGFNSGNACCQSL